jgi:hypothetical protein
MPLYDVLNKETGKVEEKMMSVAEWEQYKLDHPNEQQHFTSMHFADSVSLGIRKPPRDFQEGVVNRIKRNTPGHRIQSRWD